MAIASDSMKIALEMLLTGDQKAINQLVNFNNALDKTKEAAIATQRLEVQGRFDPDKQMEFEIEKATKLTKQLNLDLKTQAHILAEIKDKHAKATTKPPEMFGPDFTAQVRADAAASIAADKVRITARQQAEKEITRAIEEGLTARQKLLIRFQELREMRGAGTINNEETMLLATKARKEYNVIVASENAKVKAKQDAAAKQDDLNRLERIKQTNHYLKMADNANKAIEKETRLKEAQELLEKEKVKAKQDAAAKQDNLNRFERIKQTDHYLKMKTIRDKDAANSRMTIKMGDPGLVPMVDFDRIMKNNNSARRQAVALMNNYSSVADNAAADTVKLNVALAKGTISATEHANSIANINTRMRSMAGGAGNLGYVVGNLATGMEDFVTVISMTGFGMDGFAAATRSASNNVGQSIRGIGTASAAMIAPFASIAMVLVGFAIPAIYRWATGAEDSAKATEKWRIELEKLQRMMTVGSSEALLNFDRMMTAEDIKKTFDANRLADDVDKATNAVTKLKLELDNLEQKHKATGMNALDKVMPMSTVGNFNKLADFIGKEIGGDAEKDIRAKMKTLQDTFVQEVSTLGGKEASEHFKKNIDNLINEISFNPTFFLKSTNARAEMGARLNAFTKDINSQIADAKEQLGDIDKSDTLAESAKRDEIASMEEKKKLLEEQLELGIRIQKQKEKDDKFTESVEKETRLKEAQELLEIQHKRNLLLGVENEAERKLLDLSLRRQELMNNQLLDEDTANSMFDAELEAIVAMELGLDKIQQIKNQHNAVTQATAFTTVNRMVLESSPQEDKHKKEQLEYLKAIRDHLAGRAEIVIGIM